MGRAGWAIIDDMYYVEATKFCAVKLHPGVHRIKWISTFGVSVMVEPAGYATYVTTSKVALEAGHIYELQADRTTGSGYKVYLWIEDITTGRIVDGKKKP
jgi:hypothetical protein